MRRFSIGMTLLGAMLATPLLAHHMAEGIISPDLWENIDDRLEDSNSQHNEMLEITGTVMDVVTDDDTGIIFLETVATVEFDDSIPESDYEMLLEDFVDLYVLPETQAMNRVPAGMVIETPVEIDSRTLYITYELVDANIVSDGTFDYAEVTTLEPIGQGNSQDVPPESPSPPPFGNRNGG